MTNEQLYLAIGLPVALNTLLYVAFTSQITHHVDKRIDDLRDLINARFDDLKNRIERLEQRMEHPILK